MIGFGSSEVYSYNKYEKVLSINSDYNQDTFSILSLKLDSSIPNNVRDVSNGVSAALSIWIVRNGITMLGSVKLPSKAGESYCSSLLNPSRNKAFAAIGGEVFLVDVKWKRMERIFSSFNEFISEINEEDSDFLPSESSAVLSVLKRIQISITYMICKEDDQMLLVGTSDGCVRTLTWTGEMVGAWNISEVHSVFRSNQACVAVLNEVRVASPWQHSSGASAPSNNTMILDAESGGDESMADSDGEEYVPEQLTPRIPSLVRCFDWSNRLKLAAIVFCDGSFSLLRLPPASMNGRVPVPVPVAPAVRAANSGRNSLDVKSIHGRDLKSVLSLPLSSTRMHPVISGPVSPRDPSAPRPAWTADVVSKFLCIVSLSPLDAVELADGTEAVGDASESGQSERGSVFAAVVGTPEEAGTGSAPVSGARPIAEPTDLFTISVLIIRVALSASGMGPRTPKREESVACTLVCDGRARLRAGVTAVTRKNLTVCPPTIQLVHVASGLVLAVAAGSTVSLLHVAPPGTSCVPLCVLRFEEIPHHICAVVISSHMVLLSSSRASLADTREKDAPSTLITEADQLFLVPLIQSVRSSLAPHATGILVEPNDGGIAGSLLLYGKNSMGCRQALCSPMVRKRVGVSSDEDKDTDDTDHVDDGGGRGGFTRVTLPPRLQTQLRHKKALATGALHGPPAAFGGLVVAESHRTVVCASSLDTFFSSGKATGESSAMLWLMDRQRVGKWKSMVLPELVTAIFASRTSDRRVNRATAATLDTSAQKSPRTVQSKPEKATAPHTEASGSLHRSRKVQLGTAQKVIGMASVGEHSLVLLTVRKLNNSLATKSSAAKPANVTATVVALEVVSKELSKSTVPLQSATYRQLIGTPSLHSLIALPEELSSTLSSWRSPCFLDVAVLSGATAELVSQAVRLESVVAQSGSRTQPSNNKSMVNVAVEDDSVSKSSFADPGLGPGVGADELSLWNQSNAGNSASQQSPRSSATGTARLREDSISSLSSYSNATAGAGARLRAGSGAGEKQSHAAGGGNVEIDITSHWESFAVLVGSDNMTFVCYVLTIQLGAGAPSRLGASGAVPQRYVVERLWEITPSSTLTLVSNEAVAVTWPIRSASLAAAYWSTGQDSNESRVDLIVVDGMGTLFSMEVLPEVAFENKNVASIEVVQEEIEKPTKVTVAVHYLASGVQDVDRVDLGAPASLRHLVLAFPDRTPHEDAADQHSVWMYLPSLPSLGLVPGPLLSDRDGVNMFFGTTDSGKGSVLLTLKSNDLLLPQEAAPTPPLWVFREGGSLAVRWHSLLLHVVDALLGHHENCNSSAVSSHLEAHLCPATLITELLHTVRNRPSEAQLLVEELEMRWRRMTELRSAGDPTGVSAYEDYALMSSMLFSGDEVVLVEALSRLGRKLEPRASRSLFPLPCVDVLTTTSHGESTPHRALRDSPWTALALFELSLSGERLHQAARLLTLACGGSVRRGAGISSAACSLVLSLELLSRCLYHLSLRIAGECMDFSLRLEAMARQLHLSSGNSKHGPASSSELEEDETEMEEDASVASGRNLPGAADGGGVWGLVSYVTSSLFSDNLAPAPIKVETFFPPGSQSPSMWRAAAAIEQQAGPGGFCRAVHRGCSTFLTVALVAADLLSAKRFHAAAVILASALSRPGVEGAAVHSLASALHRPLVHPRRLTAEKLSCYPSAAGGDILVATYLTEAVRAFRIQKVLVGQIDEWLNRIVSPTSLRQRCELELQQRQLSGRRVSKTASASTSANDAVLGASTSIDYSSNYQSPQYHSALDIYSSVQYANHFELTSDLSEQSDTAELNGRSGNSQGASIRSLLRSLAAAAAIVGDRSLCSLALLLSGRCDLAASVLGLHSLVSASSQSTEKATLLAHQLYLFCVNEDEGTVSPLQHQVPTTMAGGVAAEGTSPNVLEVQLRGLLLSRKGSHCYELATSLCDLLATLVEDVNSGTVV